MPGHVQSMEHQSISAQHAGCKHQHQQQMASLQRLGQSLPQEYCIQYIEEYLNKRLHVRKQSVHNMIPVFRHFPAGSAPADAVVPAPSDVVLLPPQAASASDFCAWVRLSQRPESTVTATSSSHIPPAIHQPYTNCLNIETQSGPNKLVCSALGI